MASRPGPPGYLHPVEHVHDGAWPAVPSRKSRAGETAWVLLRQGIDPGEEWCALGVLGLGGPPSCEVQL